MIIPPAFSIPFVAAYRSSHQKSHIFNVAKTMPEKPPIYPFEVFINIPPMILWWFWGLFMDVYGIILQPHYTCPVQDSPNTSVLRRNLQTTTSARRRAAPLRRCAALRLLQWIPIVFCIPLITRIINNHKHWLSMFILQVAIPFQFIINPEGCESRSRPSAHDRRMNMFWKLCINHHTRVYKKNYND